MINPEKKRLVESLAQELAEGSYGKWERIQSLLMKLFEEPDQLPLDMRPISYSAYLPYDIPPMYDGPPVAFKVEASENKRVVKSAMFCAHANEVPVGQCHCPSDCYCTEHTCKGKR